MLHVVFLPETRANEHCALPALSRSNDLSLFSMLRPTQEPEGPQRYTPNAGGGCAFLVSKRTASATIISQLPKGGLAIELRPHGAVPIAVIGAYLPPTSSKRASWRAEIYQWARDVYKRCEDSYGVNRVILMGDFNARFGSPQSASPRYTEDSTIPAHARKPSNELRAWCSSMNASPAHGRSERSFAHCTSRNANGTGAATEVDYVILGNSLEHGVNYEVLPPQRWDTLPGAHVHRITGITLLLPKVVVQKPRTDAPTAPRYHIPSRTQSKEWAAITSTLQGHLEAAAPSICAPTATAQQAYAALHSTLRNTARTHLWNEKVSLRSRMFRRFRGCNLPASIALDLKHARHLRRQANHLNRTATSDEERATAADMKREAGAIQKRAKKTGLQALGRWQRARTADLQHARGRDSHTMYRLIGKAEDPLVYAEQHIPDIDGVPAVQRFGDHWRELTSEQRPPPEAATSMQRLRHVRRAPANDDGLPLDRDITTAEVMLALFPPSAKHTDVFTPCHRNCTPCRDFAVDLDLWRRGKVLVAPKWTPTIHTSVAAGPDGLPAELLRFPHDEESRANTLLYRATVCNLIATTLSKVLREGSIPESMADVCIAPIPRAAKPGEHPNVGIPNNSRGISVGNLLPKILSVIITTRLSHWAIRLQLIPTSQVAFLYRHAAEWHVLTLLETVKQRMREGKRTCILFLDLKKAYDMVHHDVMWKVLEHMRVPPRLIRLLQAWSHARSCRVRVNGQLSPKFPHEKGTPQGDSLSPLLFNLLVATLSNETTADPDLHGVDVLGMTIRDLWFADDGMYTEDRISRLQRVVNIIDAWTVSFGMEVSAGVTKTAYTVVEPPGTPQSPAESYPPLACSAGPIPCVDLYKYLGHLFHRDLSDAAAAARLCGRLQANFHRLFTRNSHVRRLPIGAQLQIFTSCVVGSINYLLGVIELSTEAMRDLDRTITTAVRLILRLPSGTSNVLISLLSRKLSMAGITAREQERVYLQLQHTSYPNAIAPSLIRALRREPVSAATLVGPATNWLHVVEHRRAALLQRGAVFSAPCSYSDIPRSAHVLGRSVSYLEMQALVQKAAPPPPNGSNLMPIPVPSHGSTVHAAAIHGHAITPVRALGTSHGATPLSVSGPGCSGSLVALAMAGRFPAVVNASLGSQALHMRPFVPPQTHQRAPRGMGSWTPVGYARRFERTPCRLCKTAALESVYHCAIECQHPRMVAWREGYAASLPAEVSTLWTQGLLLLLDARGRTLPRPLLPQAGAAALAHLLAQSPLSPPPAVSTVDMAPVAYKLLIATPWPVPNSHAAAAAMPIYSVLGALFDSLNVPPQRLRGWVQQWLQWSEQHLHALGDEWRNAVASAG